MKRIVQQHNDQYPRSTAWGMLALLSLVLVSAPAYAELPDDQRYVVTLQKGGFSPYVSVRYTLRVHGGIGTLGVSKTLPGNYGREQRMTLLQPEDLKALLGQMKACGFGALSKPKKGRGKGSVWSFEYQHGDTRTSFKVASPELQPDPRYYACLSRLRVAADVYAGQIPFRDVFFDKGEYGYLQASSDPVARVLIDGMDTGLESPLIAVPLAVGEHTVEFVDGTRKIRRQYKVKIMSEITTNLTVDLR